MLCFSMKKYVFYLLLFGLLCLNNKYAVKVWFNDTKVREVIVEPDDDKDAPCLQAGCQDSPSCEKSEED